jgi:hypothetical protein
MTAPSDSTSATGSPKKTSSTASSTISPLASASHRTQSHSDSS